MFRCYIDQVTLKIAMEILDKDTRRPPSKLEPSMSSGASDGMPPFVAIIGKSSGGCRERQPYKAALAKQVIAHSHTVVAPTLPYPPHDNTPAATIDVNRNYPSTTTRTLLKLSLSSVTNFLARLQAYLSPSIARDSRNFAEDSGPISRTLGATVGGYFTGQHCGWLSRVTMGDVRYSFGLGGELVDRPSPTYTRGFGGFRRSYPGKMCPRGVAFPLFRLMSESARFREKGN